MAMRVKYLDPEACILSRGSALGWKEGRSANYPCALPPSFFPSFQPNTGKPAQNLLQVSRRNVVLHKSSSLLYKKNFDTNYGVIGVQFGTQVINHKSQEQCVWPQVFFLSTIDRSNGVWIWIHLSYFFFSLLHNLLQGAGYAINSCTTSIMLPIPEKNQK